MKWEYLQALCGGKFSNTVWVDGIFDDDHLTSFDQLGQRNWELIAVSNDVAYFKRPILPTVKKLVVNTFGDKTE